ncbi:MAG TPA: BatA domain-containing protein [Bryobacteraceae bacterium]|nr:BatA domain-containing protein [Bryobacteraceae bacterium]
MGLFNPWFLGGIVAVGLPIWLHLLKRHRTDPQPFPSLMFFEHHETSSVKHRRLDYILLFILRALMLLLLALLFANPFIRRLTPKAEGKKLVVVAVDRSFSMRAIDGGSTRLDKAKNEALSVLGGLAPGTLAEVVALSGQIQAMTQQTLDQGELRAAVAAIQPSDSRATYGELARYLRTLSENAKIPLEVHMIGDLQKSAMPPGFTDMRLDPDTALVFHPMGGEVANWTVENVIAPQRVYDPKRVRIQATIAGFNTPAAKRNVTLLLNGKTLQSKLVDVPANGRATAEFLGLDASYGFNKAEIRIDSVDALAADDRYAFSVERTDPKKILFVDDGRRPRALLYFRTALDAAPDAAFQVEVQRPEASVNANFAGYALVVLNDLGTLPAGLEEGLKRYVTSGGSILEVLGPASVVAPRAPVLDEAIEAARYAGREGERFLSVSDFDAGHPALHNLEHFDAVKFYQAVRINPAKSRVLAHLNDGTPLIVERQIGEGKVLAFASTFDNVSNDMPVHEASWVPFIQQGTQYLAGGGAGDPVNLPVDSYVELRTGDAKTGVGAEVLDPDGRRVLSLEEAATSRNFALNREGFFEVRTASGRHTFFAAHADRRESDLAVMPKETLDLWKATGESDQTPAGGTTGEAGPGATRPWSLSPILLLLLLGVALAESVVADRYLRPSADSSPDPTVGARKEAA